MMMDSVFSGDSHSMIEQSPMQDISPCLRYLCSNPELGCIYIVTQSEEVHRSLDQLKSMNYSGLAIGVLSKLDVCNFSSTNKDSESSVNNSGFDKYPKGEVLDGIPPSLPRGVFTLQDLKEACVGTQSYGNYSARALVESSSLIVTSLPYFLAHHQDFAHSDKVLVLENCDKLDEFIMDSFSIHLNNKILSKVLEKLRSLTPESKEVNSSHSNLEPVLPPGNTVPGNLRSPSHFMSVVKIICVFFRKQLRTKDASVFSASGLLYQLMKHAHFSLDQLQWLSMRCWQLLSTQSNMKQFSCIQVVCNFVSLMSIRPQGFCVVVEPYTEGQVYNPVFQLSCLDVRFFMQELAGSFKKIVMSIRGKFTSVFDKVLGLPFECVSLPETDSLEKVCSLMLTRGSDQLTISSEYEERDFLGIMRNYGELLAELNEIVPDSIVCYFPNFRHLEQAVLKWNETDLLYRLMAQKLVFFEEQDLNATKTMLPHYKLACTSSRGAVLLALSHGFVSSSFNEEGPFKRCIVIFGVPVSNILKRVLRARLQFLKEELGIEEREYHKCDAVRRTVELLAVKLGPTDYCVQILADKQFAGYLDLFPEWFLKRLNANESNLSTEGLVRIVSKFLQFN